MWPETRIIRWNGGTVEYKSFSKRMTTYVVVPRSRRGTPSLPGTELPRQPTIQYVTMNARRI